MAMNAFQEQLRTGSYVLNDNSYERWENLLDYVKDQTLAHSA